MKRYKMLKPDFIVIGLIAVCAFSATNADGSSPSSNGTDTDPCGITGTWQNELGSSVEFTCRNGSLFGRYNSAVGHATNYYALSGRYTMSGPGLKDCILGFSVAWNNEDRGNSNSTTSWTGVYYASKDKIFTTWILTRFTPLADKWSNSLINQDVFSRS